MTNFHVGQRVLCIDDHLTPVTVPPHVTAGNVYTILHIYPLNQKKWEFDDDLFSLHEIGGMFFCWRFRPIDDPSIDIFRKMCENEPAMNKLELLRKEMLDV